MPTGSETPADAETKAVSPSMTDARALSTPDPGAQLPLPSSVVTQLQRSAGNAAVARMLAGKPRTPRARGHPVRPTAAANPATTEHAIHVQRSEDSSPSTPLAPPAPALTAAPTSATAPAASSAAAASNLAPSSSGPGPTEAPSPQTTPAGPSAESAGSAAGGGAPAGPLSFLASLTDAAPSQFGPQLDAVATAGVPALEAHRTAAEQQLATQAAPTGLPSGPVAPPATATGQSSPVEGVALPAGSTDPAVAGTWSAAGASAVAGQAATTDVVPPDAAASIRPTVTAPTLPRTALEPTGGLTAPGGAPVTGGQAGALLDSTMSADVQAQVTTLLAPAVGVSAAHSAAVATIAASSQAQVDAATEQTTANQRTAITAADGEVQEARAGWLAEKTALVVGHQGEIATESSRVRTEAVSTLSKANAEAKAHTDQAESSATSGAAQESGGWWDRVKRAGRSAAGAVAGVASSVVAAVRSIIDAAKQKVLGALTQLAATIRITVSAAVSALRAGVNRVAGAITAVIRRAQDLVTRLASALISLAQRVWRAAAERLAALWRALKAAAQAALVAARSVINTIKQAAGAIAEILKLLGNKVLSTLAEAMRDPQGKVVAPILAMAAPVAAQVPAGVEETGKAHIDAGVPTSEAPVVQREPTAAVEAAPVGEGFFAGVWRHIKATGNNFTANWASVLGKIVLGILLWFPMLAEELPKLWEECKGFVTGGTGGLDRIDYFLGILRSLVNMVAGTLATAGVYGMLFAWAGTPIAEAATVAAYEALSMQVLAADVALAVAEMAKAWYSSTRPGIATALRERYLGTFTGGLISTVIAGAMFILGAIASRLAKAFKARGVATIAEEGEQVRPRSGETPPERVPETPGARRTPSPLTPEEVASGVRAARDLPGGGRLKVLADGALVVCHSPCQKLSTRFATELGAGTPEAQALQGRLNAIAEQERAAVAAADIEAELRALNAADVLNAELEGLRLRRIGAATGVAEADLRNLSQLAVDDAAVVQRLLGKVGNDPVKVRALLTAARGDINAVHKLAAAVDQFPATPISRGSVVTDARFAPAASADLPHFVERHTIEGFDFQGIKASNTMLPPNTTPPQIVEGIATAMDQIRNNGDQFAHRSLRIETLRSGNLTGVSLQIKRDLVNGVSQIVQFFPIAGPRVVDFTREEMQAIGRFIGRLP